MVTKQRIVEFEWDEGNIDKSYQKHGISPNEAEEIFLDKKLKIEKDVKHSQEEERLIAFGKTNAGKILFVVFMMRDKKIRVISARITNLKERRRYEKT